MDKISSSLDIGYKVGISESLFGAEEIETLAKPYGIAVDNRGRVYVADIGKVVVFDLEKKIYSRIGVEPGVGRLRVPIGLAITSDGRLFVSDINADKVVIYQDGNYKGFIGDKGELDSPSGIAVDEKQKLIYIADSKKHFIAVHSLENYNFIRKFGERGNADGNFNFPTNIAVDSEGYVYVVDTGNFRIQIFDKEGKFVRKFGKAGDYAGTVARPKGISIDSEGHIYLVDAAFGNFQIFDKNGSILMFVGEFGGGPGQFYLPAGIAIDSNDRIYVINQTPGHFQIFQYMGDKWNRSKETTGNADK